MQLPPHSRVFWYHIWQFDRFSASPARFPTISDVMRLNGASKNIRSIEYVWAEMGPNVQINFSTDRSSRSFSICNGAVLQLQLLLRPHRRKRTSIAAAAVPLWPPPTTMVDVATATNDYDDDGKRRDVHHHHRDTARTGRGSSSLWRHWEGGRYCCCRWSRYCIVVHHHHILVHHPLAIITRRGSRCGRRRGGTAPRWAATITLPPLLRIHNNNSNSNM